VRLPYGPPKFGCASEWDLGESVKLAPLGIGGSIPHAPTIEVSSSGRTRDFGPRYEGSIPSASARKFTGV
jgi:hypothetical protein